MAGNSPASVNRANALRNALTLNRQQLAPPLSIPRNNMADSLPPPPNPNPTNVVFVIHGIRDKGFWTQKIARKIKELGEKEGQNFESFTKSYGYFAMLPFLAPVVRQRKVEWLMDRYAELRARYPHPATKFYYVGHSNGTYLAAHALDAYPAARFERIVFAGSVVRKDFEWSKYTSVGDAANAPSPRVRAVLNFVATKDWVVALFPKALQPWRWFNLGSAGHDGFNAGSTVGPVYQYKYIQGRHDAALAESNWPALAEFIVFGTPPSPLLANNQSLFWKVAGICSYVLFPTAALLVLLFGVALFLSMFGPVPCEWLAPKWTICTIAPTAHQAAMRGIAFFLYLWGVYLFVTRF